jgi:hypothetical protein
MKFRHRLGLILIFLGICVGALIAQRVSAARRLQAPPAALYEVVHQEIEAVLASDFTRAYEQVSTGMQEKFDVEAFAEHLRTNYPDARRIERVEFGRVAHDGLHAVVQVFFFLPGGDIVPCIYTLVNEDSVWKIDAAHMQKRWPSNRRLGGLRS